MDMIRTTTATNTVTQHRWYKDEIIPSRIPFLNMFPQVNLFVISSDCHHHPHHRKLLMVVAGVCVNYLVLALRRKLHLQQITMETMFVMFFKLNFTNFIVLLFQGFIRLRTFVKISTTTSISSGDANRSKYTKHDSQCTSSSTKRWGLVLSTSAASSSGTTFLRIWKKSVRRQSIQIYTTYSCWTNAGFRSSMWRLR